MPTVRIRGLGMAVLIWLLASPAPAYAGNAGFAAPDNVGRTTAVLGVVVLAVAVIAARFITHLGGGSHQ